MQYAEILLEKSSSLCSQSRLDFLTAAFIGKPYLENPLGEGEQAKFDQSPRWRFDGFDCVTYVNTVLALYFSSSWYEFEYHLAHLNYYGGNVRFENRFHFMSVDWNTENAAQGYVYDFTSQLRDENDLPLCCYAYATINKPAWIHSKSAKFHTLAGSRHIQRTDACTPYLSLGDIFTATGEINAEILDQLPKIAVVEIVRPGWNLVKQIGTQLNISHVGFLIKRNQHYLFRHASQTSRTVVEQLLVDYLKNFLASPTIKGINVQGISGC